MSNNFSTFRQLYPYRDYYNDKDKTNNDMYHTCDKRDNIPVTYVAPEYLKSMFTNYTF